jgi:hypothetical protein
MSRQSTAQTNDIFCAIIDTMSAEFGTSIGDIVDNAFLKAEARKGIKLMLEAGCKFTPRQIQSLGKGNVGRSNSMRKINGFTKLDDALQSLIDVTIGCLD